MSLLHSPFRRVPTCALPLALMAVAGPSLCAQGQELPTLKVTASVNEGAFELQQTVGFGAFTQLQVRTLWDAAGTWCIPIADVRVADQAFFSGVPVGGWEHEFATATTPLTVADLTAGLATAASATLLAKPVAAHPVDFGVLAMAVGPTPTISLAVGDPLYLSGQPGVHLVQLLGTNLWPEWTLDPAVPTPMLNLDAVVQATAWKRLATHPSTAGMTQTQFFESAAWSKLLFANPTLTVTVFGLRGPRIDPRRVPPPGAGVPLPLLGYPNLAPKLTVAPPTKITVQFVGSGLGSGGRPRFHAPSAIQPVLLPSGSPGGAWQMPMTGFAPGMQLAMVHKINGQRLESTVAWNGFGNVSVPIPTYAISNTNTPLGIYEVASYRYALQPAGSGYGPWIVIPAAERKNVKVL